MAGPRFSTILISYNQADFIDAAVRSLLASSFEDFELICVDDGSSDDTYTRLLQSTRGDTRVRLTRLPHSGRPADTRNVGLALATGEYVCFLDGDDIASRNRLKLFDQAITASGGSADVVFGDYVDFHIGPAQIEKRRCIAGTEHETALLGMIPPHASLVGPSLMEVTTERLVARFLSVAFLINTLTVCIRRDIITSRGLRFPSNRTIGEDNIFWLQCLARSRVVYSNHVLAYRRQHPGSLTATRTSASQRELVSSMTNELTAVADVLAPRDEASAKERIYREEFEVAWLLEREGAWPAAMAEYFQLARRHRSATPLLAALKAPLRNLIRPRSQ